MSVARVLGSLSFCLATCALHAAAQRPVSSTASPPPATGLILGTVIDAGTGQPVPGAMVTLGGAGGGTMPLPPGWDPDWATPIPRSPQRVLTGADGRFVYRGLAEGHYTITASKGGYLDGAFGRRRPGGPTSVLSLEAGERVGSATVHLWKHSTITGTIVDEAGEPVVSVQVRGYRLTFLGGRRQIAPSGSDVTDDRGIYRISSLIPGEYLIAVPSTNVALPLGTVEAYRTALAANDPSRQEISRELFRAGGSPTLPGTTSSIQIGDAVYALGRSATPPPPARGPFFVYSTVFYPAAPVPSSASVIAVGSGEEKRGIDVQLKPVPSGRASGVVMGPDGPAASTALHLVPVGSDEVIDELASAGTMTDANGAFTFVGAPRGQYTLKVLKPSPPPLNQGERTVITTGATTTMIMGAPPEGGPIETAPVLWGSAPVTIGDDDATGIVVTLRTGFNIRGRVEFVGASERPAADRLSRLSVTLVPAAGPRVQGMMGRARVDAKGEFVSTTVGPGSYLAGAGAPSGWFLRSVSHGNRDLSDAPFDLAGDLEGVVVSFTDTPSELTGGVRTAKGTPDPDAAVLIFPADPAMWTVNLPRRMRLVRPMNTGRFSVKGLPAGEYLVVAVPDEQIAEWRHPAVLEARAPVAARVHVTEGQITTRDLQTVPLR
jgi:protocatechuate 3,4-dioxygenase beta subunit